MAEELSLFTSKFIIKERTAHIQYRFLYNSRLNQLAPILQKRASALWGDKFKLIAESANEPECYIIGVIFKRMDLQPSILKQILKQENFELNSVSHKFLSDSDTVFIEDSSQMIGLKCRIPPGEMVTGLVVAAYGKCSENGIFVAEEMITPYNYVIQQLPSIPDASIFPSEKLAMFISCLSFGSEAEPLNQLQIISDFIIQSRVHSVFQIETLIIAGNIFDESSSKSHPNRMPTGPRCYVTELTKILPSTDSILYALAREIDVILMPGINDPTGVFLPQQPLHKCFFTETSKCPKFHLTTNPTEFSLHQKRFMGLSGYSVSNLMRYTSLQSVPDIIQMILRHGVISPLSPDAIPAFPFRDDDPFVISDFPDVCFVASQESFNIYTATDIDSGKVVKVLSVPDFSKTHTAALVGLESLNAIPFNIR